jgi:hypothetical protein
MFNIEDKYEDLSELLTTEGLSPVTDVGNAAEALEVAISSTTQDLQELYRDIKEAGSCDVQAKFRHIDGIETLDDEQLLVVESLLADLCFDFQRQIEGMTKYDRVDSY